METINKLEIERKIGYWQHALTNIENRMLKMQSERVDMKEKLAYLHHLEKEADIIA